MKNSKAINFDYERFQEKQKTISYKIQRWFNYTRFGNWYLNFKNGIKQLFKWRKVIYNNWDYDYGGLYDIIDFKLKTLREGIERRQLVVGWEEDVKWIKICQTLCKRVREDYYGMEYYDYVDTNFRFEPINDGNGNSTLESDVTRDDLDDYFSKYFRLKDKTYNKIKESPVFCEGAEEDRKFLAIQMGEHRHNKARRLLFKILAEKIEYWWD